MGDTSRKVHMSTLRAGMSKSTFKSRMSPASRSFFTNSSVTPATPRPIRARVTSSCPSGQRHTREPARTIILDVLRTVGLTATADIRPNLYLCKAAMDIMAKHIKPDQNGDRIAQLNERTYRVSFGTTCLSPISGESGRGVPESWRSRASTPWEILPGVPSESPRITTMRICSTRSLVSTQNC